MSGEGGRGAAEGAEGETTALRGRGIPRARQGGRHEGLTVLRVPGGLAGRQASGGGAGCGAPGQPGYKGRARGRGPGRLPQEAR